MNFKFNMNKDWVIVNAYGKYAVLGNFSWHGWTSAEAQEIIDGIMAVKDGTSIKYDYQIEDDLYFIADAKGVFLYNLHDKKTKEQNLILPHTEFLDFMEKLKSFLESEG